MAAQSDSTIERLRWRVMVGSVWSPDIPALATGTIPSHLKGVDRIQFVKHRTSAQRILKQLFPPDED
jgi:hypothetical protein